MFKKIYAPIIALSVSVLMIIGLAMPAFAAYASYGGESQSQGLSGFKVISEKMGTGLDLFDLGFLVIVGKIAIIVILCFCVVLLILGTVSLIKTLTVQKLDPYYYNINVQKIQKVNKASSVVFSLVMSFAALAFLSYLIFGFANRESESGFEAGYKVGFGSIFNFIISLAAVICLSVFNKKFGYAIYQQNVKQQYNQGYYGQPQYDAPQGPQYGQYGQPQYGASQGQQYGQPQYGQPQYGAPQGPQYGQPQYGAPQDPQYGQPQYGQQYGAPQQNGYQDKKDEN